VTTDERQLGALANTVAWLEDELRETRAGMAKLAQALDDAHARIGELTALMHRAEDTIAGILPQLTAIPRIDNQIPRIKESIAAVQTEAIANTARLGDVQRQIDVNAQRERQALNDVAHRLDAAERHTQAAGARIDTVDETTRRTLEAIAGLRQRSDEIARAVEVLESRITRSIDTTARYDQEQQRLAAELEGLRKQDDAIADRVQLYTEMIKRLDGQIARVGAEVAAKQDVGEKLDLFRVETHRLEERISGIEASAGTLRDQDDEVLRQLSVLEGRQKGFQDRLNGLLADVAVHRAQTADQFQRMHQLHERLKRRQVEDLERDLREMRIHAFKVAEEQ
jgi:chromosome segregation ATPase